MHLLPVAALLLLSLIGSHALEVRDTGSFSARTTTKDLLQHYGRLYGTERFLEGKVAIVTGANSGLGLETSKALLAAGCKVYMCSRSVARAEAAVETEVKARGLGDYMPIDVDYGEKCLVRPLDLGSLSSVRSFADSFLQAEGRLDLLVLNAGVMATPSRELTADGFEMQIGTNHFGHAAMVHHLQGLLQQPSSRVVVLSSTAHTFGEIDLDDISYSRGRAYTPWGAYGQSKLANLMYARELSRRMEGKARVVSVHPGVIKTNLWRETPLGGGPVARVLAALPFQLQLQKSIPQGAATQLYACVAPRIESDLGMSGAYLVDCAVAMPSVAARDDGLARRLFDFTSEEIVKRTSG